MSDVAGALSTVRSYHFEGSATDQDGPLQYAGDISVAGPSRVRYEQKGQRVQVLRIGTATYLRANDTFWRRHAGGGHDQAARLLGDRWVKTRDAGADLQRLFDKVSPRTLAACVSMFHGAVSKKGTGRVGGQRTVIVHDDGERAGGTPADLHVAAEGRPLPLREVQTGPERPGKSSNTKCADSSSTTTTSDLSLSRFDEPVRIAVPKGAIDLDSFTGDGRGQRVS